MSHCGAEGSARGLEQEGQREAEDEHGGDEEDEKEEEEEEEDEEEEVPDSAALAEAAFKETCQQLVDEKEPFGTPQLEGDRSSRLKRGGVLAPIAPDSKRCVLEPAARTDGHEASADGVSAAVVSAAVADTAAPQPYQGGTLPVPVGTQVVAGVAEQLLRSSSGARLSQQIQIRNLAVQKGSSMWDGVGEGNGVAMPVAIPRLTWSEYCEKFRCVGSKREANAVIGEGSYGKVSAMRRQDTGELLAVKVAKSDLSAELEILSITARIARLVGRSSMLRRPRHRQRCSSSLQIQRKSYCHVQWFCKRSIVETIDIGCGW